MKTEGFAADEQAAQAAAHRRFTSESRFGAPWSSGQTATLRVWVFGLYLGASENILLDASYMSQRRAEKLRPL